MSKKLTNEEFIKRAREVHGDKYDYSKVEYVNADTKVCIICPNHGEFWQRPANHLSGQKCKKCKYEDMSNKFSMKNEEFISKSKELHGNKYDYSRVEYVNNSTKVCIICPKHGVFWQRPAAHLQGIGCNKCGIEHGHLKQAYNNEVFIKLAKKVHDEKYDYSKVEYKDSDTLVCIICPIHGEFWQRPADHLQGRGCNKCKESSLEKIARNFLESKNINYVQQCSKHDFDWLDRQSLDFYLPQYKIAIECQGEQHFKPIEYFGGKKKLLYVQSLDRRKKNLCEGHGIKLYYINYDEDVETKLEEILEEHVAVH